MELSIAINMAYLCEATDSTIYVHIVKNLL